LCNNFTEGRSYHNGTVFMYMISLIFLHKVCKNFFRCIYFSFLHILTFLIVTSIGFTELSSSGAEELLWPIDSPRRISSSFGEPRPGRFHFGIDFKSNGITGKKIFAVGDGYISRVRTTPFGYGKVLYLTLDSGKTAVYCHLSRFLPEIEDKLFHKRIKKRSYDVEWWLKPNEIKVKQGQVIAHSGDTGDGPPHLHMEIRDEHNIPMNPLNHGVFVKDTIAPEIDSVVIIPLDKASSVDGLPTAVWYDFSLPNPKPFMLSGRIGIAVSVHDKANWSNNHLGIYRITLYADSTVMFSKTYDVIPLDINKFGSFDYLRTERYGGQGLASALFRRTGNMIDFYTGDGVLLSDMFESGKQLTLSISAEDYAHNTAERSFSVLFGNRPFFTSCGFTGEGKIHISGQHISGLIDRVEIWKLVKKGEWTLESNFPVYNTSFDITEYIPLPCTGIYKTLLISDN